MEPIELMQWLIPGSAVGAASIALWRWLSRGWRADLQIRAKKLKEFAELENNIESAYGAQNRKRFKKLIDDVKRPALESTATRIIIFRDKQKWPDIVLYASGGLIIIAAIFSTFATNSAFIVLLSIFAGIGTLGLVVFLVNMVIDERRAKAEAKQLVSDLLKT